MATTTKNFAPTKCVLPCRISFANIWEPKSINGSEEKYSVSCLIRKTDKATLDRLQKAIDAAIEDGNTVLLLKSIHLWASFPPRNAAASLSAQLNRDRKSIPKLYRF